MWPLLDFHTMWGWAGGFPAGVAEAVTMTDWAATPDVCACSPFLNAEFSWGAGVRSGGREMDQSRCPRSNHFPKTVQLTAGPVSLF